MQVMSAPLLWFIGKQDEEEENRVYLTFIPLTNAEDDDFSSDKEDLEEEEVEAILNIQDKGNQPKGDEDSSNQVKLDFN